LKTKEDRRQGRNLALLRPNCEKLTVCTSGLAANICLAFFEYFENLAEFACGTTFQNANAQNISMCTLTSTLPFLTIEITHFNIPNLENGDSNDA